MANIFLESFDNITGDDLLTKGYTSFNNFISVSIGPGRTGNGLILDQAAAGQIGLNKILPSNYTSLVFGGAFKTASSFPIEEAIWSFSDANFDQLHICMDTLGRLIFRQGTLSSGNGANLGPIIGSSNKVYDRGAYYFFEFKIVFSSSSSGSINYRVNGISQPSINNVQTSYSGNQYCNIIRFWTRAFAGSDAYLYYHDDIYANDTTGSDNNDYMGDVRIFIDRPAAAAGSSQWAVAGATSNAAAVGDVTPDADTSYISSNTAGQIDLYTLSAPPSGVGVVKAVQTNLVARKDDGIIRQIAPVLGDGVHSNVVGSSVSIGNNYVDYLQSFDRNPLTGAAWAVGDLSTLRLGVKEVA
ncbi:hypothetical protein CCAX7_53890 [Capsulimonas corticalis]|uniref:Uncharacterized protein n=1 Tax=Capsulimonas corticalis TaxID=2219043 RepID=A0A402CNQ5_9BACT|nr:hypothetical protein [Capsulimonas corticalis]BDI33338.1 hypothetical protein CCAX7_53890 [Capsulimonas corticalis]